MLLLQPTAQALLVPWRATATKQLPTSPLVILPDQPPHLHPLALQRGKKKYGSQSAFESFCAMLFSNFLSFYFFPQGDHTTDGMDLVPQPWVSYMETSPPFFLLLQTLETEQVTN